MPTNRQATLILFKADSKVTLVADFDQLTLTRTQVGGYQREPNGSKPITPAAAEAFWKHLETLATKGLVLDFAELHRSHPLVTVLADHLIETALQGDSSITARCAATETDAVQVVTTVYLLRLRHQLGYVRRRQPFQMMAEETVALGVAGRSNPQWLEGDAVAKLLECTPSGNLPPEAMQREIRTALDFLQNHPQQLQTLATQRAAALLADHQRVREAARDVGQYSVSACLPVDVMGVYVLLPGSL
jgi:hypothetical protein